VAAGLVVVSGALVGCAPYNGDQAEFCRQLPKAPSFESLLGKTSEASSTADAVATLDAAAQDFRSLEQSAPRSIRYTVTKLGDTAERLSDRIERGDGGHAYATSFQTPSGEVVTIPAETTDRARRTEIIYQEFRNHPSVARSAVDLLTYAHDECGITSQGGFLGLNGYGAYLGDQSPFGSGIDGGPGAPGFESDGNQPGGQPPVTVGPSVSTSPAPATVPPAGK
jgi:hypothetical protein